MWTILLHFFGLTLPTWSLLSSNFSSHTFHYPCWSFLGYFLLVQSKLGRRGQSHGLCQGRYFSGSSTSTSRFSPILCLRPSRSPSQFWTISLKSPLVIRCGRLSGLGRDPSNLARGKDHDESTTCQCASTCCNL
jgi:hypothetical protein